MRFVRFLVYGVPLLLAFLVIASFWSTTRLSTSRKNEITIGSIGEPAKINPILSTDSSASQVESFLFEGLLTYDENLELIPNLANRFTLSQTTTYFFATPEAAEAARVVLDARRADWPEWSLTTAVAEGNELRLTLSQPGVRTSEEILSALPAESLIPVTRVRADAGGNARALIAKFRLAHPAIEVVREWYDYDVAAELTVTTGGDKAEELLRGFLKSENIADAQVAAVEGTPFLAEPAVRFALRDDVRWEDGVPFTARDVAFTYWALTDASIASPRKSDFDGILKLETPSDFDVIVTYRRPFSPALASWTMPIIPAHILEGKPLSWWDENFHRKPVGLGPFKFTEWKTNEFIRLDRNPDYYRGGPWLDAVIIRTLPDPIALRIAFETRQIDYWGVDPWAVKSFKENPAFEVFSAPARQYNYVGWNLRLPIFEDLRVRQAFAHAVNTPAMIKYILYGNGTQSTGVFPPLFWFANPDIQPIPYDPDRARSLLDEAGWIPGPDGIRVKDGQRLEFKLITNQGNEIRKDIATLVQDNLRAVGASVNVEIYEWAVFISRFIMQQEFESVVLGWTTPPDFDVFQVWHSSQAEKNQLNLVGYKNPKADAMMEQIRLEYDRDEIIRLARDIQRTIFDDQPVLFLFVPDSTSVLWKNSFRIRRPSADGGWVDTPIEMTPAGWQYYMQWFYRPEYANQLPPETRP